MTVHENNLKVTVTPDGAQPQTLQWQGRAVRVLCVEAIRTYGLERRYRVRTAEGRYELGLELGTGTWQMRRGPNWLDRARARLERVPRYPLPIWRRRARKVSPLRTAPVARTLPAAGGQHANRLALVRQ